MYIFADSPLSIRESLMTVIQSDFTEEIHLREFSWTCAQKPPTATHCEKKNQQSTIKKKRRKRKKKVPTVRHRTKEELGRLCPGPTKAPGHLENSITRPSIWRWMGTSLLAPRARQCEIKDALFAPGTPLHKSSQYLWHKSRTGARCQTWKASAKLKN